MTTAACWEYCKLMKRGVSLGRQLLSLAAAAAAIAVEMVLLMMIMINTLIINAFVFL